MHDRSCIKKKKSYTEECKENSNNHLARSIEVQARAPFRDITNVAVSWQLSEEQGMEFVSNQHIYHILFLKYYM